MIIDALLAKIAPYECLGCNIEGRLLCHDCSQSLQQLPARCYRCQRLSKNYRVCTTCQKHSSLYSVIPCTIYAGIAKELVWRLKFSGAQSAAREIAQLMSGALSDLRGVTIVPVPTASSRARRRAYDQAVLLARAIAHLSRSTYAPCLRRLGQAAQVGANREQRNKQLREAFRVTNANSIQGTHILLIDDVLTTGATLEAAAKILKAAGASRVSALVFAQA